MSDSFYFSLHSSLCPILSLYLFFQVERTWDLVRDSAQRKLTYSSQNHCTLRSITFTLSDTHHISVPIISSFITQMQLFHYQKAYLHKSFACIDKNTSLGTQFPSCYTGFIRQSTVTAISPYMILYSIVKRTFAIRFRYLLMNAVALRPAFKLYIFYRISDCKNQI